MPLSPTQKKAVIKKFQTVDGDTGSPEVQIALLTERIERLTEHLKQHANDVHSRRGLLSMIAKRRRLINFLSKVDKKRASEMKNKIGLKDK
ncbi:MAG: 30S ribosomal protein S15 [Candidatus Levybacteria bacterium]|nr:30S ribosomal protein S15 [Candidatus Levybacteria bacterium]